MLCRHASSDPQGGPCDARDIASIHRTTSMYTWAFGGTPKKPIRIGDAELLEVVYGWRDIQTLVKSV